MKTTSLVLLFLLSQTFQFSANAQAPGNDSPPPARVAAHKTPSNGVALLSEEGQQFVGHQLELFTKTEAGVLGTKKPAWINLYHTEGRDFVLTGEVSLGGAYDGMRYPGDLPEGFALFLREWDGLHRYQLNSRNVTLKRRLLHGQPTSNIIPLVEGAPNHREEWIPFRVRVSEGMIEYSFAGNTARIPGPLDTDGANKIAIAPGTRLRNLRLRLPN